MKTTKYIIPVSLAVIFASCAEEAPDSKLSVTVNGIECKVGEPVIFNITGKADNIVFYSGEAGHEYDLKNRLYADNDLLVEFVSYTDQSTGIHPNFQVLTSNDFNGIYDPENVTAATWTDITDLFTLPSQTGKNTPSGSVSLKDYTGDNNEDLTYLAFRYYDKDGTAMRNRWVVRTIDITKVSPEGASTSLATIKTAGWQNVIMSGTSKWTLPGTQLLAAGNINSSDKDFWAISTGFDLHKSEPSTGIVLKNISTDVTNFGYTYTKPGTYRAVFASSSEWYNSKSSSITSVEITVSD